MSFEGPCTVKGGLPLWAECWYTRGDGYLTEYHSGVTALYWLKRDGTKGKEVSQKVYDSIELLDDYWECDVLEAVFEYSLHCDWERQQDQKYQNVIDKFAVDLMFMLFDK